MNVAPDCVFITVLSLISLRNCTCGAISEPNAAVAIRQPPPSSSFCNVSEELSSESDPVGTFAKSMLENSIEFTISSK